MSKVTVRPAEKEDAGFILSTWSKGAYFGAPEKPPISRERWFKEHYLYVCDALNSKEIRIACLAHDPNTVLGYAVSEGLTLEWVYIKKDFRQLGIAKLLSSGCMLFSTLHITKVGQAILDKRKREEDERRKKSTGDIPTGDTSKPSRVPPSGV